MNRFLTMLGLTAFLAGCGGPDHPPPAPDKAQLEVKLVAKANPDVHGPRSDSEDAYSSSGSNPEKGRCYERVDYDDMGDIAVWLRGGGLGEGGPVPATARLRVGDDGADHRLVLLGPKKRTQLTLENGTKKTLTLGCQGPKNDGFLATVPPGKEAVVTLSEPGVYEMTCDEDECLLVTLVVAPTSWAALGRSGSDVFFDNLPPGEFEVVVQAPRLPDVIRKVSARAGARSKVEAKVSVTCLESVK
ncbi:MAG: hypothetical protein K8T20_07530 [Planctomycetes bacterium]|nr:hypothetical protein [Planctomycetota bacterium]